MNSPRYVHVSPIRWRDLDALGHVNYATYLTYLEEARDVWLTRELGVPRGTEYVVGRLTIEYRSELVLADDPVRVEVVLGAVGNSSLTTLERVLAADSRLAAEAEVKIVFWDASRRRARPISQDERAALERGATTTDSG
jgi:acyl-CoA thioester hydrolase